VKPPDNINRRDASRPRIGVVRPCKPGTASLTPCAAVRIRRGVAAAGGSAAAANSARGPITAGGARGLTWRRVRSMTDCPYIALRMRRGCQPGQAHCKVGASEAGSTLSVVTATTVIRPKIG
jgi:hypothetical protein